MKRYLSMFLLIVVCFLLQTTLFHYLRLGNVLPNLILTITAISGFMYGRRLGMFSGVLCGALADLLFGDVIGINIFIYALIGYENGAANKLYFKEDFVIPVAAIAISDLVYGILFYGCNFLLRGRVNLPFYLMHVMIPEVIYTVLVGILIYCFVRWLDEKINPPIEIPLGKKRDM